MLTHKTAIQAAAVKLNERAEACFENADAQHKSADLQQESADLQHANAEKLEVLGTALETDAAQLFGETQVNERLPAREGATTGFPVRPSLPA